MIARRIDAITAEAVVDGQKYRAMLSAIPIDGRTKIIGMESIYTRRTAKRPMGFTSYRRLSISVADRTEKTRRVLEFLNECLDQGL